MPDYWYKKLTNAGVVEEGWMTVPDERELEERLRASGSFLVEAAQKSRPKAAATLTDGKIERKQLMALMEYLAGSVQVGMPILTTLADVETRLDSRKLRKIVVEMRHALSEEGKSLSEAMAEHPQAFPELYIVTVEAGETSGRLDFVLAQLVEYLDWQQGITGQVRQATMYPLILLVAVGGLVLVLVMFVFPRILPVLLSRTTVLPLPTRIVMTVSQFLRDYYILVFGFAAGILPAYRFAHRTERGGRTIDLLVLRLPVFGELMRQVNMARLVTYLGLFYRSGVNLILALELVERLITNRVLSEAIGQVRVDIEGGNTMASAFSRSSLFSPVVIRSVALGETTGRLDESLARAAVYYAREVPVAVRRLITALQPALILLMGGIVLMVALAMILPILSIYNEIGVRR
ncbi:MAG: type II secretion system F family protein [Gemmatimonadaceae bacterium]|nr:type II secretion system F family protein [Gemmatimonadaceae bacterium]